MHYLHRGLFVEQNPFWGGDSGCNLVELRPSGEVTELVECTGLENRRRLIAYPGFESLPLRQLVLLFSMLSTSC